MGRMNKATAILDAAEKWKQRCLLDGGSLFSEERLWRRENFRGLQTYFVERPDEGSDSFEEKLRRQLEPAPPEMRRLWAEITWAYYLIVSSVTRVKKLDRIRTVWESSGTALPEDHWALGDVLDGGVVNPGMAYARHQWLEFRFIITIMLDWCSRAAEERESLLNNPWDFATWVDGQEDGRRRQFRHALLFLLFPDVFEPILSIGHKKSIVKALTDETAKSLEIDRMSLMDLDKGLAAIKERLRDKYRGHGIRFFHESPIRELWQSGSPTPTPNEADPADDAGDEAWYRDRFGAADVWGIGAGEGARLWGDFLEHGVVAIGWDDLGDLSQYDSRDAIHGALIENGAGQNPRNQSLAVWEFVHEMKIGDVLIAKRGRTSILGWGRVTGDYTYESERAEYQNLRTVDWHACRATVDLKSPVTTKTLTRFTPYKDWLRGVFELIDGAEGRGRSPNLDFEQMGIPVGSVLVSTKSDEEATVLANNRVTFRNESMSLSAATEKAVGYRTNPCPQWTFRGRNVGNIYRQTYGKKPELPEPIPYDIATALNDLFVEESQFQRIRDSIALRKNLILQGPPGVGKTFIARRIAWCLIGRKDSRPLEMVQFHQSYAYEDFVQGWRPTETGGFRLRNGVFFEFCKRAEQEPETPFVFIIDEINRGNLSKIFGELLMLIESDKRGHEHAIALTYGASGDRFSVPENVHLLGLMNTADRSLAIVDYALRRRFAFETLKPAYGTRKFREYLLEAEVDRMLVDRIDRNLSALNERIGEDKDLGPGFQIGHSYFVPEESADEQWFLGIVDTQIAPLLREYWFDRPEEAERRIGELRR